MKTGILIAFAALYLFGILNVITLIGKPRQPVTPKLASQVVAFQLVSLAAVLYALLG
jgi:hypothetical protein